MSHFPLQECPSNKYEDSNGSHSDNQTICICCLRQDQNVEYFDVQKCSHAPFLNYCLDYQLEGKCKICEQCHEFLKKVDIFKAQVKESHQRILSNQIPATPLTQIWKPTQEIDKPETIRQITEKEISIECDVKVEPESLVSDEIEDSVADGIRLKEEVLDDSENEGRSEIQEDVDLLPISKQSCPASWPTKPVAPINQIWNLTLYRADAVTKPTEIEKPDTSKQIIENELKKTGETSCGLDGLEDSVNESSKGKKCLENEGRDEIQEDDQSLLIPTKSRPVPPPPKLRRTANDYSKTDTYQSEDSEDLPRPSKSLPPQTNVVRKTKAQKQREYRLRMAASRTMAQALEARKLDNERQKNYRLRKALYSSLLSDAFESTETNEATTGIKRQFIEAEISEGTNKMDQSQTDWNNKWAASIMRFKSTFLDNDFGYACSVCDRLWCKNDLKPLTPAQMEVITRWYFKENRELGKEDYDVVCNTCKRTLNKKTMPLLAKVNGFSFPEEPPDLPPLDPISERLISPRLPFMQVRRLRCGDDGITGQVINIPLDDQGIVKSVPRQLDEDDVINVNIQENWAQKTSYISKYVSKSTVSSWLTALQESPLYRLYKINVDLLRLNSTMLDNPKDETKRIENFTAETPELEILASRQHTLMWNEEDCLNVTPGHQSTPLHTIYDRHAEELSFPSIYFGEPRQINKGVSVTPHMIASSEIRRRDRRGATPQKILYVAMKILRQRMSNGIHSTFRSFPSTENVTRRMIEDTEFMKEHVIQNLSFMKTVPNSVQYWASRKRNLFAMIRQLGKPTIFLTMGANETRWTKLLSILLKLSKKCKGKSAKDLSISERCTLVSEDPVTCCIYFNKLVGSLMKMLKSKQSYNPFGKYYVKDYFLRFEFQRQGSPHAHILMWLNADPQETVSEMMPRTIELMEELSSVAREDVGNDSVYANQIHKHNFTCTKQGETCVYGIPYWPMITTQVLLPLAVTKARRQKFQKKAKELRASLSERRYSCMDEFFKTNSLTYSSYLDIVRSTLNRPTLLFKRNFEELMTNTFNPFLAGAVNSNVDIQFILDEQMCAEYIVEYFNKPARGMSSLRRELTRTMEENPEQDFTGKLEALSLKMFNADEMTAQEAAWFILQQPMSETSRQIVYIPTVWPTERQRCRKRRQQMDREGINEDSTDVWTKNIIQRYEERPASLEQVYLAEFAAWYANANDFVEEEDDMQEDSEAVNESRTSAAPKEYRRRPIERVIRYRRYDIENIVDYKREMVLLFVQFRNEIEEIINENKFLQLFEDHKDMITERRKLFETDLNTENMANELEAKLLQK